MFLISSKPLSDRRVHNVALLILLAIGIVGTAGARAKARTEIESAALIIVARRTGLPLGDLQIVGSAPAYYPQQGRSATHLKISDQRSRAFHTVLVDQSGQELHAEQLQASERTARETRYGKLDPALAQRLDRQQDNTPLEVIIWLKQPPRTRPIRPQAGAVLTRSQLNDFRAQVDDNLARHTRSITAPITQRLAHLGYSATTDAYTPLIYATLPPKLIRQIARWAEIDQMYAYTEATPDLSTARQTLGANIVNGLLPGGRNITGSGVKVAIVEASDANGKSSVASNNPYLSGVTQPANSLCPPSTHATGVAGIIRSTHAIQRGIAPDVDLWAGGECHSGTVNGSTTITTTVITEQRATAAADWGARAINLSWGSDTDLDLGATDRFYDTMVFERFITVVKSAGNRGQANCADDDGDGIGDGEGDVTSPGLGYNVLTVGAINDRAAPYSMQNCSSWGDPTSIAGDREKPEIAAPGESLTATGIVSTTATPWINNIGSGTSFAAPMATGVTALLMQRAPSLEVWPEIVKSILMTTATHNIEGDKRLSEKDGAGGIRADRADDLANTPNHFGGEYYTCPGPMDITRNITTMTLTKGVRTRATVAWSTDPSHADYLTRPTTDLDLIVLDSARNQVAASLTFDNTYEIVDFVPPNDGDYTLMVSATQCHADPPWLGWAWHQAN